MEENSLIHINLEKQRLLKEKIEEATQELELVQQETLQFEAILRSHLSDLIIEEQELSVLYKELKKAKKLKRLQQKQKGKKLKISKELKIQQKEPLKIKDPEDERERKRLYREAMLFSHPDKFSLDHEKIELATEVTTQLIELYKNGALQELKLFHLHIMSGNALAGDNLLPTTSLELAQKDKYLENKLKDLLEQLQAAKNKHTYKVQEEYKDPMSFLQELKEYYDDRIFKLKKRTRKA